MKLVPIAILKAHPKNYIFKPTDETIRILAADLKERGLQEPILINRDYVIFSGHKRVEAAKRLGWTEIEARIEDIPLADIRTLILANTARQLVGYATRLRIYEAVAPDLLRTARIKKSRLESVSREIAVPIPTIRKDLSKYRGEDKEISLSELKEAWLAKDPALRVSLIDAGRGLHIVQVASKNFKAESGPAALKEVLSDSFQKACSTLYERAEKSYQSVGQEIRRLRQNLRMTQTSMAEALGISQSYLAECEAGLYKNAEDILERIRNGMEGAA